MKVEGVARLKGGVGPLDHHVCDPRVWKERGDTPVTHPVSVSCEEDEALHPAAPLLEPVWSSYSRSQPVVQFAVLWPLGVDTLRPFDHEAHPEDRRCRTRLKLYRPYAFYTVITSIRSDAYRPKPASPCAHQNH